LGDDVRGNVQGIIVSGKGFIVLGKGLFVCGHVWDHDVFSGVGDVNLDCRDVPEKNWRGDFLHFIGKQNEIDFMINFGFNIPLTL
jgi:hypothetical protein